MRLLGAAALLFTISGVFSLALSQEPVKPQAPADSVWRQNVDAAMPLSAAGDYQAARARLETAWRLLKNIKPQDLRHVTVLNNLGSTQEHLGAYNDAERCYREALKIRAALPEKERGNSGWLLNNYAGLLVKKGNHKRAEALYHESLEGLIRTVGPIHSDVAGIYNNLSELEFLRGDKREAAKLLEQARSVTEQAIGPNHVSLAVILNNQSVLYEDEGEFDLADAALQRALEIWRQASGPDHPATIRIVNNLALLRFHQRRFEEADELLAAAIRTTEQKLGQNHPDLGLLWGNRAIVLRKLKQKSQAQAAETRATDILGRDASRTFRRHTVYVRYLGRFEERGRTEPALHPDTAISSFPDWRRLPSPS